ncbi:MAG TPA: hypothetical protein VGL71_03720, partial [Urbifossiella sp.]
QVVVADGPGSISSDPARRIVLIGWALLTLALFGFVAPNRPTSDEWFFLAELTGEKPLGPWLFAPHNEHRYPLSRLIWVGLHRLTGYDFRAGMFLSMTLLAGTSLALMNAARRLRGRSHAADLLIPTLLLHFGHWENWLTGYQLAFTIPVAAAGLALAIMLKEAESPSRRRTIGVGLAAMIMTLNGGAGILLGVPIALWAMWNAVRTRCWPALMMPTFALAYSTIVLLFLRTGTGMSSSSWGDRFTTFLELLAGGFGILGRDLWPVSGFVAGAFVLIAAIGLIWIAIRRSGTERQIALRLLSIFAGSLSLAAAIALSRTGMNEAVGFSSRYGLFGALWMVAAYLAGVRFLPLPKFRFAATAGIILAMSIFGGSIREGLAVRTVIGFTEMRSTRAARAGHSTEQLAAEEIALMHLTDSPYTKQLFQEAFEVLARHRLGPYRP